MDNAIQPAAPFRGIVFDMDGVLCDSEPFICEAAMRMFAERHHLRVCPEDFRPFVGAGEDRYLGGVAQRYGIAWNLQEDKKRTYQIYLEIIRGRLKPLAGAVEFIARCRRSGMRLAVATSADAVKMQGNLAEIGLPPETFDVCVNGLEVVRKKPDPEIFSLAIRRLGLAPKSAWLSRTLPTASVPGRLPERCAWGSRPAFPPPSCGCRGRLDCPRPGPPAAGGVVIPSRRPARLTDRRAAASHRRGLLETLVASTIR